MPPDVPLQSIEPQRLYRQIADQLRTLIGQGEFEAGARLPAERDLARQLGVSRPSVREALIALEVEGWVEVRTGSGVYVQDRTHRSAERVAVTEWGPLELIRARRVVEGQTAALAAADTNKVAYVESGKLLDGYKGMQDARKAFEAKAKRWEAQNQSMVQNFQAAVQQYQKQGESMSPEQRAATEQKLGAQQQQVGQNQQKLQQQAQDEEAKMTQAVLERVNKQIEKYGKANGYRLILSGSLAYGRKDLDITQPVLKYLNQEYTAKK